MHLITSPEFVEFWLYSVACAETFSYMILGLWCIGTLCTHWRLLPCKLRMCNIMTLVVCLGYIMLNIDHIFNHLAAVDTEIEEMLWSLEGMLITLVIAHYKAITEGSIRRIAIAIKQTRTRVIVEPPPPREGC